MSAMKVWYEKLGGHYHCTVFTARAPHLTFAHCGELVFDELEWGDIQVIMGGAVFVQKEKVQPRVTPGPSLTCRRA
jgi:hypothetical protein